MNMTYPNVQKFSLLNSEAMACFFVCLTGRPCGTRLGPGGPGWNLNPGQIHNFMWRTYTSAIEFIHATYAIQILTE